MARNQTLEKLLRDTRAEARLSLDPAHNVQTRDSHVNIIQREQERLWEDFAWPHLRVERFIPVEAGQRYYDVDSAVTEALAAPPYNIPIDRIEKIEIKSDARWLPMGAGIDAGHYAAHDSQQDERAWPPRRWRITEDEMIEVWPLPDQNATADELDGYLKITGIRSLRPLVADTDRADLDGRLLSLYAAGAILAAAGAKDASLKLEAAARHFGRLKGALTKTGDFNMFSTTKESAVQRPYIGRFRPPVVH